MNEISADEYNALAAKRKPSKYRNVTMDVDGHTFASRAEARRYGELKLMEQAGEIFDLELHPRYNLHGPDGMLICTYVADFQYLTPMNEWVVEDVKGGNATKTAVYRIKKKLMLSNYGIDVTEVTA